MSSRRNLRKPRPTCLRRGVTLTELLIVIGLMAFLSSIALVGLWEAQEVARESRAQSQVQRIDALLTERWDDYASRAVAMKIAPVDNDRGSYAKLRVNAIRELARFELPDRILDVNYTNPYDPLPTPPIDPPTLTAKPSALVAYRRLLGVEPLVASPAWTPEYQGAECLYAILSTIHKDDENGLAFFKPSEIGDKDGDQRFEIHDPWGNPIEFIRWAPGFSSPLHTRQEVQTIGVYGNPTGGTFLLKFAGTTTPVSAPIDPLTADKDDIQDAIENDLGGILDPDNPVTGPVGGPWVVRFAVDQSPALLIADVTALTGGSFPGNSSFVRVETNLIDPFDPDEAYGGGPPLHPLVVSAGRDGKYGMFGLIDSDLIESGSGYTIPACNYSPPLNPPNNPYAKFVDPQNSGGHARLLGDAFDYDGDYVAPVPPALPVFDDDDRARSTDNISNHLPDAG